MSELDVVWRRRKGGRVGRATQSERHWLDFVVDGASLYAMLNAGHLDLIGGFGWGSEEGRELYASRLLLRQQSSLESGRVPIFVCPECGDIDCGAITARIRETADAFSWSEFGYENDYDPTMARFEEYSSVGPFVFERSRYLSVLLAATSALRGS